MRITGVKQTVFKQQPIDSKAALQSNIKILDNYLKELDKFRAETEQTLQDLKKQKQYLLSHLAQDCSLHQILQETEQQIACLQSILLSSDIAISQQTAQSDLAALKMQLGPS